MDNALVALQAGGTRAAAVVGASDKIGSPEAAKYGDLIAVDGHPLRDIEAICRVIQVTKGGVLYAAAAL